MRLGPWALLAVGLAIGPIACGQERPPAPVARDVAGAAGQAGTHAARLNLEEDSFSLTYAGERGEFKDTKDPTQVPDRARGLVRVTLLDGRRAPAGMSYVVNLDGANDTGGYALETIPVDMFEELALGRGLSSAVVLPGDLSAPPAAPPAEDVVVYKTDWCGVCKKLTAYLDKRGIPYVARDIEKDVGAAAELKAKADKAGVPTGSVPVVDVEGTLMVGFDRERLERMLTK